MNKIVKGSTVLGKKLISAGQNWEGYYLWQVYDNPSDSKKAAWDDCFEKYRNSLNAGVFGICSHNTFSFSVSWFFDYADPVTGEVEPAMKYETSQNSYTVLLNR